MNLRADCHWARAALGSIRRHLLFLMLIVSKLAHDRVNASAQIREVLGGRGGMKLTNTEVMDLIPCQVTGGLISQIRAKMLEERKARASHEVVLTAQQVGALEDFFWSSRIARMLVALSRRDPDLKDDPRYQVRMGQKFFGVSLADILALHDFEEPCFSSSPWHSERLGCIKELTRDKEPSEVFAVAYYVFLFGSKAFVQRLRSSSLGSLSAIPAKASCVQPILGILQEMLARGENPFHRRYQPQQLFHNMVAKAFQGVAGGAFSTLGVGFDLDSDEEENGSDNEPAALPKKRAKVKQPDTAKIHAEYVLVSILSKLPKVAFSLLLTPHSLLVALCRLLFALVKSKE